MKLHKVDRCEQAEHMHFMTGRAAGSAAGHACAVLEEQVMNDAAGVTPTALNLKQEYGERAQAYAASSSHHMHCESKLNETNFTKHMLPSAGTMHNSLHAIMHCISTLKTRART